MRKITPLAFLLTAALVVAVFSCKKEAVSPGNTGSMQADINKPAQQVRCLRIIDTLANPCGTSTRVNLIASNGAVVGTVTVGNDTANLYVTFSASGRGYLNAVHLFVGDCTILSALGGSGNGGSCGHGSADNNNQGDDHNGGSGHQGCNTNNGFGGDGHSGDGHGDNNGGAQCFDHFTYNESVDDHSQLYTVKIPLSSLSNCFCVAANVSVSNGSGCGNSTVSAWAPGATINASCGTINYFSVCKQSCSQGCVLAPGQLFQGEPTWPNGPSVTVAGFTYVPSVANLIYSSPVSDSRSGFILIASLKISAGSANPPAEIVADAAIVETWLATLGQLSGAPPYTAPANVEAAIAALQAWETAHICP